MEGLSGKLKNLREMAAFANEDWVIPLKEKDQSIKLQFALGKTVNDILNEDIPLLEHLTSGFSASASLSIVSNVK